MEIKVVGNNFDLGNSLRLHTEEILQESVAKYFPNAVSSRVSVSREGRSFHADAIINEGVNHGALIKATATESDPYSAIDSAVAKVGTKMRRYKRKLKDHRPVSGAEFKSYLQNQTNQEEQIKSIFVEEEKIQIRQLSLEDAAMHLDLTSLPTVIFVNVETHKLNIMYKKDDGRLVLVDTDKNISE